jgi:predicted MarR family transcription regulator
VEFTELEFALMRTYEGFARWQSECLASVADVAASGPENALLHIIRMNERPKTIKDLARLTNRDDVPNIQYSLRKLIGAGLVERKGTVIRVFISTTRAAILTRRRRRVSNWARRQGERFGRAARRVHISQ